MSMFETALSKLASILGDDTPEATAYGVKNALAGYPGVERVKNALNPDPQVTNRASMLPIGNYDDGSVGLAIPQSLIDAKEAFRRFQRGEAPQPQDAVLAGLAMAGSGFGGLGARAVESGAARFAANPKEAAPAGMVAASAGERQGIRAYHGSPHDFDRFEASKLGTGEGNQAYGNGLYFAEAEDVARTYRDSLAGQGNAPQGRMYEVNINANPDQFLDWNKPLSEQSDAVRAALEPIARAEAENELRRIEASRRMTDIRQRQMGIEPKPSPPLPTVEEYMQRMQGNQFVGNENALRDAGIPGMRYLDGFSRETGQGTTNYVVFPGNENLIDIMRKYSNPKEAAPAGLLATSNLDRMKAAESAPARSIPDAPQSMPELQGMIDSNLDRFAVSRSVGDQAFAQDPARYNAYAYGLHDVMNPDSEWMLNSPTLQSGGSAAPAAATSGEHHSRAQPRGEGGRFVAKDSFDGRLAALDKILVDLDGDGTPDAVMDAPQAPGNALRMANLTNRPPQSDAGNVPRNPAYDPEDEFWKGLQDPRFGPSPDRTPPPPPSAPPPAPGNALAMRRP